MTSPMVDLIKDQPIDQVMYIIMYRSNFMFVHGVWRQQ